MKTIHQAFLMAALGFGALAVPSAEASAQGGPSGNCALCSDCHSCKQSLWGTTSCNYRGPAWCPCQQGGGRCNPTVALNVDEDDRRVIETHDGDHAVVRLAGNVFGAWDCEGELRAAFREVQPGTFAAVRGTQFAEFASRYSLEAFVETLTDRWLAAGL